MTKELTAKTNLYSVRQRIFGRVANNAHTVGLLTFCMDPDYNQETAVVLSEVPVLSACG